MLRKFIIPIICCLYLDSHAQIVPVGQGGYTTTFPGTDVAGRNGYPNTAPLVSGPAATKPIPTNDWWSSLLKNDIFGGSNDFAENLFNYPISMQTTNSGLVVSYIPFGVFDDQDPIIVGVSGLNATKSTVSDFSDWTVTMNWDNRFEAISGIGMPFIYFSKETTEEAAITINLGTVTISNEMILVTDARNGADFVIYAPSGSTWSQNGNIYTSTLNGNDYWSMAMLPQGESDVAALADEYKKYAYVFPTNTEVTWTYDETSSVMRTEFQVETDIKEGTDNHILMGLLPHQWDHLSADSPTPNGYTYTSVRGDIKTLDGNAFTVEHVFHGILPTLPYVTNYSDGFNLSSLNEKIEQLAQTQLATWTDSYNEGQSMNQLIQTARIAHEIGNNDALASILATIKERLEDWLKAESGEVAFLFYYRTDWTTLLGYPAGHGQDTNINDHHFHWGYFIHAAAFLEQFEPGWADDWGEMINLLIRDASSPDREDELFPFLRNFSPYAGHCWANGMAAFPQGNDQESTSESMQFNASLIHWGTVTGNDEIRDLGIYLYTTEQSAIEEYWFDVEERIFPSNPYALVSRVWGNGFDNGTFWTNDIEASYGIELYPIHGGSLYLGHHIDYAEKLWAEIEAKTGILTNDNNVNLWHDTMWKYLSFTDPQKAIDLYDSYPDRSLKFGISDAQTYYWIHAMNALGQVAAEITANHPIAAAFQKDDELTYTAHNYSDAAIDVTFSDGYVLAVPANTMATSKDVSLTGTIRTSFPSAHPGGSVELTVDVEAGTPTKVEFYDDGNLIGEDPTAPFTINATNLVPRVHGFYAQLYDGEAFSVTPIASVMVGDQVPYDGPNVIPGTIEAGHYDRFEGGTGQHIAYLDVSSVNEGNYRLDEAVDVALSGVEGATMGWIAAGEWVEYTIEVDASGLYDMSFRYASANPNGGGPFNLLLNDVPISPDISVSNTGDWDAWQSGIVQGLAIPRGTHVLRLSFEHGEFNIGRMEFTFKEELPYGHPVAEAGENEIVILPETTGMLDGSQSQDPDGDVLSYSWEQIHGPSIIAFSDQTIASPEVSNLVAGVYKCQLVVSDGTYSSKDEVLIIVSETGNIAPVVSITSPTNEASFRDGEDIMITASASDLEGEVVSVSFYDDEILLGEDLIAPFEYSYQGASIGTHPLTALATDNFGATSVSDIVTIHVSEVISCEQAAKEAAQGSFSIGYKATVESVNNDVTVLFELLDTDKSGIDAFLREESENSEIQMEQVSETTFTTTLTNRVIGETIRIACRFAYTGGEAVTTYLDFEVGAACPDLADVLPPENFDVTVGEIMFNSIELILTGMDDSGVVVYTVSHGSTAASLAVENGANGAIVMNGLSAETMYSFQVTATDLVGNVAVNSPLIIEATTSENTNTSCAGTASTAQEGVFERGYTYAFETNGTDVTITFELLDDRDDVIAYLWQAAPFTETVMTHVSGQTYSMTVSNLTPGTTIRYACKFAFAGGLAVSDYYSYVVGDTCNGAVLNLSNQHDSPLLIYPNPVSDQLTIDWKPFESVSVYSTTGHRMLTSKKSIFSLATLPSGIYYLAIQGLADEFRYMKVIKE